MRNVRRILVALAALVFAALIIFYVIYGRGQPYRDLTTNPLFPESRLQTLATLDYPPGNVAVAADSRIFFNYHPLARAQRFVDATVFELVDGKPKPYPDAAFQKRYQGVFGLTVDRQQRLWLIEPALPDHERTRLLAFDLKAGALVFEYWFPAGQAPCAQDLRVSPDGETVYLASPGVFKFTHPAIIVFDVATRTYREALTQDASTLPQNWLIQTRFGPLKIAFGMVNWAGGVDGIELSHDGRWLFYAAMNHDSVFKAPTADLRNIQLTPEELASRVQRVGAKPLSDGMTVDADDNILITDVEHGGIARIAPNGKSQTLVRSPDVIWADGIVVAPDGAVLFTDSAIPAYLGPFAGPPSQERLASFRPYRLYRLPLKN